MFKKIFLILILYCSVSFSNERFTNEKVVNKYFLQLQEIPVLCGPRFGIESYLKDFDFQLFNLSIGRAGQLPNGEPVFVAEYYINKKNTETVIILSSPAEPDTACINFRTFDLKQGEEINRYLMKKNRQ